MLKLYNNLSARLEEFVPLKNKDVGIYVCGPTVYDVGHIGHGRSAVCFDIVRKYLIYKGYNVTYVSNITDIEDKMIARADLMKITVKELADKIIPEYIEDYGRLGVMEPDFRPKATECIPEMLELIEGLEKNGYTYVTSDGVYFDVSKFEDYGKLSKQRLDELKSGIRVSLNEEKRNPYDFVLWKFAKPGEPMWESKWGAGRPGWHIECSAMSNKYLNGVIDIHGGGADLAFPHHECEIAQSEAYSGKQFVKYWIHNGFICINNEKMSKSLNNFFTMKDIFKLYKPQAVRFLFLQTHYASPINYSDETITQASNALNRMHDFIERLSSYDDNGDDAAESALKLAKEDFEKSMDNNFDTAGALAACFDLIKHVNKLIDHKMLSGLGRDNTLSVLKDIDGVLGVLFPLVVDEIPAEIKELATKRDEARAKKDWAQSDAIRDELAEKGYKLEDSPKGTVIKKL